MLSIGEFSRISGMSVKTLRYYHEQDLLVPAIVDSETSYRYYGEGQLERARIILQLKAWQFSLTEIRDILSRCTSEADLLGDLERQLQQIEEQVRRQRTVAKDLKKFIADERQAERLLEQSQFEIIEQDLPPLLIAGYRMHARYDVCGTGFSKVARALGRYLCGSPLCLYHVDEYQEDEADYETCFPVRPCQPPEGITIRELPGGQHLTLRHLGPYPQLGRSYSKLLKHARQKSLQLGLPSREVYLKGPGMIFRGNPQKYLTEIQIPVAK
jgi:DNA-binding transcriptional MerR regulator/effector-binding domain-containing protein